MYGGQNVHRLMEGTLLGSINATETGLMTSEGLNNILYEAISPKLNITRYDSVATITAQRLGWYAPEIQKQLEYYSKNFNRQESDEMKSFMSNEMISKYINKLEEISTSLFNDVKNPQPGDDAFDTIKKLKKGITYKIQHAILQISKAEFDMWQDCLYVSGLVLAGGGVSCII